MRRCSEDRQRIIWAIAIAAWLCASAAQAGTQCTYFVRAGVEPPAPGSLQGQTPETAFDRITDGARALANAGDVLCVGPGRYEEGNIEIPADADGVPGAPVEIRADTTGASTGDPPGAVEIVAATGTQATTGFLVRGALELVIDGFSISGFSDACIQVRASATVGTPSRDVTIRNNRVTGCGKGIDVFEARERIEVEGNTAVGNAGSGINLEACLFEAPSGRCQYSSGATIKPVVSNNRSGGNGGAGIFVDESDDAIIQNNVIYSNDSSGIALQDSNDALVANNLVYFNEEHGLSVGKIIAAPGMTVLNNTFYANGSWGIEIGNSAAGSPGASVVNNIVWRNGNGGKGIGVLNENTGEVPVRPASVCRYLAGFNLVLDDYGPKTPHNVYDRTADPLFVDPAGPDGILGGEGAALRFIDRSEDDDFHLRQLAGQGDSPAVNAGSANVAELGLSGSTATNGRRDRDTVDIGFHYGASPEQELTFVPPFMPIYVRAGSGSDSAGGQTNGTALATIGAAAERAEAGITVVVGSGSYPECNLHPPPNRGLAMFLADPSGDLTGDAPGAVVVDAGRCDAGEPDETGFDISSACGVVVDGFHVTGGTEHGIRIDEDSDGAVLRNNVVFDNRRGIEVINSADVRIANNLAFSNGTPGVGGGGIAVGSRPRPTGPTAAGSRRAVVEFNTAYANAFNGIQIGDGTGISSHATVRYNVTGENGKEGLEVGDDERQEDNLVGFDSKYNLIADGRGEGVPRGTANLIDVPAGYLDPTAITTGDWASDQHFRLMQTAAGQALQSRAVDHGSDLTVLVAGLVDRTTRSDGEPDAGNVDLGYHYPLPAAARELVGDCDGDGTVRVNELVLAVNIALGLKPMSRCLAIDADGDGMPAVSELVRAVGNGLRG